MQPNPVVMGCHWKQEEAGMYARGLIRFGILKLIHLLSVFVFFINASICFFDGLYLVPFS